MKLHHFQIITPDSFYPALFLEDLKKIPDSGTIMETLYTVI